MDRKFYSAESLSRALLLFEQRFEMSSEDFYEAHQMDDESVLHVPGFDRHLWASFYREVHEADDGEFVASVERTLELA